MPKKVIRESPIKEKPLRRPGQSIDEKLNELIDDKLLMWGLLASLGLGLAGLEWWRWYKNITPSPWSFTIVALILLALASWRWLVLWPKVRMLQLGKHGEVEVGQYLDLLQEHGHRIFHDLVTDRFNVDHVIIGPKGVFVVETKTFGKRPGKNDKVHFRKGTLNVDGMPLSRDPIVQTKAAASWVAKVLQESTGKSFRVRSVLVFPGWFVNSDNHRDIWVINPKNLPSFLANEKDSLPAEDAKLATYHLSRHIRTS